MADSFELFLLGCACVIDTVLLLVVFERINRAQVSHWLQLLIVSTWLVHVASFFHLMLEPASGAAASFLDRTCMLLLSLGYLMLPSAMLHGAFRLNHTRLTAHPNHDRRYGLLYLPLLLIPVAAWFILRSTQNVFLHAVYPLDRLYLIWLLVANLTSAILFMRVRRVISTPGSAKFFSRLAISIIVITALAVAYVLVVPPNKLAIVMRQLTLLSPLVPAFLFLWYILRQRLLPLVIERTFVYGGLLTIVLLLHRLTISQWTSTVGDRINLDFVIIEWFVLFGIIMLFRPLRARVRASLRYLLSSDVAHIRDATRLISVQLSQQFECTPTELIEWFSETLAKKIAVDFVLVERCDLVSPSAPDRECLFEGLQRQVSGYLSRGETSDVNQLQAMEKLKADLVFRLAFRSLKGLVVFGPRLRSDRLADEQLTALAMLCDQFAATLFNRELELQRLRAERKSMQQEKLSALGLITSSLAHEIRNPLSSIRTIATLMREDLSDDDSHIQDVSMILSEIDRLSQTTQRLLDYAKPSDSNSQETVPEPVITRLLHILEHLARQHSVTITTKFDHSHSAVAANDASLSEIVFNLIRNAIEAAAEVAAGQVNIVTKLVAEQWEFSVSDNGKGIDDSVRNDLFRPFVTGKADGTGLGLYVASERVKELSGTLECESHFGVGSTFTVRLNTIKRIPAVHLILPLD